MITRIIIHHDHGNVVLKGDNEPLDDRFNRLFSYARNSIKMLISPDAEYRTRIHGIEISGPIRRSIDFASSDDYEAVLSSLKTLMEQMYNTISARKNVSIMTDQLCSMSV